MCLFLLGTYIEKTFQHTKMYVLKMLITLDIVVPLLEFISKGKKRCTQRFMPNTIYAQNY